MLEMKKQMTTSGFLETHHGSENLADGVILFKINKAFPKAIFLFIQYLKISIQSFSFFCLPKLRQAQALLGRLQKLNISVEAIIHKPSPKHPQRITSGSFFCSRGFKEDQPITFILW